MCTFNCFMLRSIRSPILGFSSVLDAPLAFLQKQNNNKSQRFPYRPVWFNLQQQSKHKQCWITLINLDQLCASFTQISQRRVTSWQENPLLHFPSRPLNGREELSLLKSGFQSNAERNWFWFWFRFCSGLTLVEESNWEVTGLIWRHSIESALVAGSQIKISFRQDQCTSMTTCNKYLKK